MALRKWSGWSSLTLRGSREYLSIITSGQSHQMVFPASSDGRMSCLCATLAPPHSLHLFCRVWLKPHLQDVFPDCSSPGVCGGSDGGASSKSRAPAPHSTLQSTQNCLAVQLSAAHLCVPCSTTRAIRGMITSNQVYKNQNLSNRTGTNSAQENAIKLN